MQLTKPAKKKPRQVTYENGDISKDGIPMISVVVDGAWSKRSYRFNYNALSGVVSKILFSVNVSSYTRPITGKKNKYVLVTTR